MISLSVIKRKLRDPVLLRKSHPVPIQFLAKKTFSRNSP